MNPSEVRVENLTEKNPVLKFPAEVEQELFQVEDWKQFIIDAVTEKLARHAPEETLNISEEDVMDGCGFLG